MTELVYLKRLGEELDRAGQYQLLVPIGRGVGGQDDNGLRGVDLHNSLEDFMSRHAREHQVQDHKVMVAFPPSGEAGFAVVS